MQDMTSNQPYLLRAFFDWIIDNDLTPYMVVDVNQPDVTVPMQFVNDGQIVLNVSPNACVNFSIDKDWVQFQARFSGQPMLVSFPCSSVGAIYAKENGAGTVFTLPEPPDEPDKAPKDIKDTSVGNAEKKPHNKPGLRIVK